MNEKFKRIMNLQFVIMILSLIFIVVSFFVKSLAPYREIVLGIILLMMGYTNLVIYEKKKMALVYFLCGAFLIISNIIGLVV